MSTKRKLFTAIGMALCMSIFMSLVMVFVNVGVSPYFFKAWLKSWSIGFLVSLPLAFIVPPMINKFANKLKL